MGIAQLIFSKGNFIGEIELDVIVSESAQSSATITSNHVENGADVKVSPGGSHYYACQWVYKKQWGCRMWLCL